MKDYLIGIKLEHYIDEQYIRDRDEGVRASSKEEAIEIWVAERKGWLRDDEHRFIHIFAEQEAGDKPYTYFDGKYSRIIDKPTRQHDY